MKHCIFVGLLYCVAVGAQPLSIEDALRAGEAHSPRLAAQRHAVDAASEQVGRARELPDPRLKFGIENLPVTGEDRFRYGRDFMTSGALGVMQEFPNSAKRAARGERAAAAQTVEQASLASQRAILHRDIATAWLEVYYAERGREALERLVTTLSTQSQLASAALARGRQTAAESLMLRTAYEQARERVLDQERNVRRARINLAVLVGDEGERPLAAAPDTARLAIAPELLLKQSGEHANLRVFDLREELARADVELARASRQSDWALEVSYGQRAPYYDNMLSVIVSMDLPWQRARRQDRDVASRLAELEQARALREDARRMHDAEMRGFVADFEAADARTARYRELLIPLSRDRYDAALAAYRGGRGELNAVLDASRGIADTEIAALAIEADRAKAWASLTYLYADDAGHDEHVGAKP